MREVAVLEFVELIVYPEMLTFIDDLLLSAPLPPEADLDAGIQSAKAAIAVDPRCSEVVDFLSALKSLQPAVALVSQAWADFDLANYCEPAQKENLHKMMAKSGVFSALVKKSFSNTDAIDENFMTEKVKSSLNGLVEDPIFR